MSPEFKEGAPIPTRYTFQGANINPPLTVSEVPTEAVTLALIVEDPDAPNGTFTHWLIWDIPPRTGAITENFSGGIAGTNDFRRPGYCGPCPPSGLHHYHFQLFALDRALNLPAGATRAQLGAAMSGHVISRAEMVGIYSRG
jgi:Raf kinase inhibitor-like YbhB/YbcL family protein